MSVEESDQLERRSLAGSKAESGRIRARLVVVGSWRDDLPLETCWRHSRSLLDGAVSSLVRELSEGWSIELAVGAVEAALPIDRGAELSDCADEDEVELGKRWPKRR